MSHFHPLVHKAFDLCFKGSGHPEGLDAVMDSAAWKEQLNYYQSLPKRLANTQLGELFNAGPHQVGVAFCQSAQRDLWEVAGWLKNSPNRWQPNPYFLATVAFLGEELLKTAIGCLPAQLNEPALRVADWSTLNLPLTTSQLAEAWHGGDNYTRVLIGNLLAEAFYLAPNKKPHPRGRDILRQKPEYVLPGFFGPWDEESEYHPNCLGKAIMLAAFAQQADIEALMVIPTQTSSQQKQIFRGELAQICLAGFSHAKVPLLKRRRQSLETIARVGRSFQEEPSWLHGCIALRLEGELWLLIDPNEQITSIVPLEWTLGKASTDLNILGALLPGLSFLEQEGDSRFEDDFPEYRRYANGNTELLANFAKDGFPPDATKLDIIERLVKSELLDVAIHALLDEGETVPEQLTFTPNTPRRYKAICLLLEYIFRKLSKTGSQELGPKVDWRESIGQNYSASEEMLLSKITDNEARRGLETLCYAFGTRVFSNLSTDYQRRQTDGELMHPRCQISGVGYFLAASALGHVAYCLGSRTSLKVESLLYHHAFDLYRLHVAAGRGITHWKNRNECQRAFEAVSVLEQLPFVLPSTQRILPHLQKMRSLHQVEERGVVTTMS